jgi:hypothetical protein
LYLRRLRKEEVLKATTVLSALLAIGSIGKELREERNTRAHEGIQRPFGEDPQDTFIFKYAAMTVGRITVEDFDLKQDYTKEVTLVYETYFKESEALRDAVWQLQDVLVEPFGDRFERKQASKQSAIRER